jgi:uncharacterized protein (DUF1810 family)
MINRALGGDLQACEQLLNKVLAMIGLGLIGDSDDLRSTLRHTLLMAIVEAGDRRQAAMQRYLPGVSAIYKQAYVDFLRPPDKPTT